MGRRTKTRKSYRLSQKMRYTDTRPEMAVRGMIAGMGFQFIPYHPIKITDNDGKSWNFSPDLWIPSHDTIIEVDGPYHDTARQKRKTAWRDSLLTSIGLRIIHIDAELTKNAELLGYLNTALFKALWGSKKVVNIAA